MPNSKKPGEPAQPDRQIKTSQQRWNFGRVVESAPHFEAETNDDNVIDLREYWNVLIRRRTTVFIAISVAVVVALVITSLSTPLFRAESLIQIEREEGKVLEYQDVMAKEPEASKDFYETQYELLQSRSLAQRVISQLDLQASEGGVLSESPSYLGELITLLKRWTTDASSVAGEERGLETAFLQNLTVSPVRNSRLVRVIYDSPDAGEAAAIANAIGENFIDMNLERRFEASSYAKTFLQERIQEVRASLEKSERQLVAYARDRGFIAVDDKLAMLMHKLDEMEKVQIQTEAERFRAEAEYQELLEQGWSNSHRVLQSRLVQNLKERKANLEAEFQEKRKTYKPGYPMMQRLQQQIAEVEQEIASESESIAKSVKADFDAKVRQEAKITQRIDETRNEIIALQSRSTDYQTLKRDVETNRELYDGLLQRMKEVAVAAGVGTNNISVVDLAEIPLRPYKPSLRLNLGMAIVLGLFGGGALAFLFEATDDTMKSSEQIEKRIAVPVLGVIPVVEGQGEDGEGQGIALLSFDDPRSALAEAFRSLRMSLALATSDGSPRVLHFTSSSPKEGKTTAAVSTAITFAQAGKKVLLIDGDLRNPSLHRAFSIPHSKGLSTYLTSDIKPTEIAQRTKIARLSVITSGHLPPNPVELLSSQKMHDLLALAQDQFDLIIIDGPPVVGLADALVLADIAMASLFIVAAGETRADSLDASIKRLRFANARIVGCVLTKAGKSGGEYDYGYDYHYSYTYGSEKETDKEAAFPKPSLS